MLGATEAGALGFAAAFGWLARAQGADAQLHIEGRQATVRQTSWRLMEQREALSPAAFDAWNELWVGAALAHDRFIARRSDRTPRPRRCVLVWQFR
jgi:hypothetical protein